MRKGLWICFVLLVVGCNDSDHFSYERLDGSIHYKLLAVGDETLPVSDAEHLSLSLTIIAGADTLAIKQFKRVNKNKSIFPVYLHELFKQAHEGDEISILGNIDELELDALIGRSMVDSNLVSNAQIELTILEAFTDERLRTVRANERLQRDIELKELSELALVTDSLNLGEEDYRDGIYMRFIHNAHGKEIKKGDYVKVHYQAVLVNGKEIDNNFGMDPFEYEIGKPDQVIPGFSIGMSNMNLGSEALFIIPPKLAFGNRGSSSGIVKPGSMVIYRVKLIEIN